VRNTERLLLGLTGCKCGGKGVKGGVFSVLCEVSKMCFGTFDCDGAHCYSEQTERFEQNSESVTDRLKQIILCRKIVLVAVNSTLYDVDCNEVELTEVLYWVK